MSSTQSAPIFDVFLSYHSGDAQWACRLKAALEAKKVKVWLDSDQIMPGDLFGEALERGLESSKSIALIVSSGSLQSDWVKEEYYRALGLSNVSGRKTRLIPVVIESAPVPGFLSSRSWADFRDSSRFEQSVDRLYAGITGSVATQAAPANQKQPPDSVSPASGVSELKYLDRSLAREIRSVRQLQQLRLVAPILGLAGFGVVALLNPAMQTSTQAFAGVGAPLVTGLIGWGVTARQLSASRINLDRLTSLKDGLELCRETVGSGCPRLWTEFWRVVHRNAGVDAL